MNIGKAMQAIREERGLSRRELAELLDCTQTSLWKIETGKVWPKKSTIKKFCQATHSAPARLLIESLTKEDFCNL